MADIKTMEAELHELRENTLSEFKEVNPAQMDAQKLEEWNSRNEKMSELVKSIKEAKKFESEKADIESELEKGNAVEPKAIHGESKEAPRTLGQELIESKAYKSFMQDGIKNVSSELKFNPSMEFKTTLTETGYPPAVTRSDLVVPTAVRDPQTVLDLIDTITTDTYQYKYLEETTFTNNSSATAEGSALGENALAFTEKTENIRKIGAFLPVTEELLADVSAVQGYLDSRLRTMVNLAVTDQIIAGGGVAPNLTGILNATGINTFAYGGYSGGLKRIGQIYEAITEIQKDSFLNPDAIIMHPSDWYQVVTEVADTSGTSGAGFTQTQPLFIGAGQFGGAVGQTLWGLPVVLDTTRPAGTAIVGVFGGGQAIHIVARQGMEIAMSDSHDANFTKDIMVMKATVRLGLPIYRASAFCSITGL
ncbi:MAG: putative major capsid protein [Prokaryotic dsDNA virus sp.]|jgi:HK97 family phage major capsid protein|nr:MAG: putative major capsid protein [Prokaryotic dsDNA virus sp.]QDP59777.1 MAG: putative major capsid protein [Prokaryotic dsDNA virus sp.]|tara:strand:- start:8812 stop:10074 length:1263 start_codon:yes stop_codon:yes gene_type:complete